MQPSFLYNKDPNPKKQVEYALEHQIPVMLMIGENELKEGVVGLKVLKASTQVSVARNQVVEEVKKALSSSDVQPSTSKTAEGAPASGMAGLGKED